MVQKLSEQLHEFHSYNQQEESDLPVLLKVICEPDVFTRDQLLYHFTASSWIVNSDRTKVLMCYHNIYQSWSWTGGHADGNANLLEVALKEAKEETGLQNIRPVSDNIYSVEILTVPSHIKRGKFVNAHLHLNATYLLEADESELLCIKEDENSGLAWMTLDEAIEKCTEPEMIPIYQKLNNKLKTCR